MTDAFGSTVVKAAGARSEFIDVTPMGAMGPVYIEMWHGWTVELWCNWEWIE